MKSKILALFAVFVLATAVAGTAYAAWTSTLTINGTVATGTMSTDIEANNPTSSSAYTGVAISGSGGGDGAVTITISNAYPGVTGTVDITMRNTGTVPVKVTSVGYTTLSAPYDNDITFSETGNAPAVGDIIAPGATQVFTVHFTVTSEAVESGSYPFTATINFGLP